MHIPLVACLVAASLFATMKSATAAVEEHPLSLPPATGWQVESSDGTVDLGAPQAGIFTMDFQLKITKSFTVGYKKFEQATARVLLKEPLRLVGDDARVLFECRGMERILNREGKIQIMPLVRDREGEIFVCDPYAYPHLNYGIKRWSLWTTCYLYAGEAGGPTQNIYQTDGKGNGWPDAPLSFAGFEIQARGKQGETLKGEFAIGEMSSAGMHLPQRPPLLYADSVLDETRGSFTFSAEASTEFQGRPAYGVEQTFDFDPASLASRKQKLLMPTGPEKYLWGNYQVRDGQGKVCVRKSLDYRLNTLAAENPNTRKLSVKPTSETTFLRVSTAGEVPGVIPQGKPFGVTVHIPRLAAEGKLELKWKLQPANYRDELASGQVEVTGSTHQKFIALPETAGRDGYRFEVRLLLDGKPLDQTSFLVGRPTDFSAPYAGRTGKARLRKEVKQDAYFRTTFRPDDNLFSEVAMLENFCNYARESSKMARDITITVDPALFEVLPGVFDFSLLDRMMDAATDFGAGITVRLSHADIKSSYLWPKLERQTGYDGGEIYLHYYGNYSPHDPTLVSLWEHANRALHDRYCSHPSFQGYYLMEAAGESGVLDQPWMGIIAGYSEYARVDFQHYLQMQMGLGLEDLNKRWSSNYSKWSDIEPPLPDFSRRTQPDLRPQWLDFQSFKYYMSRTGWFKELASNIRSYDKDHVIICYSSPVEYLKDLIDYIHGGGVMHDPEHGEDEQYWISNGVGSIQESIDPHHWGMQEDPAGKGWALDWNLYTMFSRCGGGGMNLHIYYTPVDEVVKKYGGIYQFDRFQRFKPVMSELEKTRIVTPLQKRVAVMQEMLTGFAKHRTTFLHRFTDLSREFKLLQTIGVDFETYRPEQAANYRLVFPNFLDEVLPQQKIDALAEFVRKGGKLVISANTGRYSDAAGSQPYALLRALGIEPPKGDYVTSGTSVIANTAMDHPLTRDYSSLAFYTLEQQHAQTRQTWDYTAFQVWPYRWLSESDYFGYYPVQHPARASVLAQFSDGGAALSLHSCGDGEVAVFWGSPDYQDKNLLQFLKNAVTWAKADDDAKLNAIPHMIEAHNQELKRHYAILWQETPGIYKQRFPQAPDGKLVLVDLISDQRLGVFDGATLRQEGANIEYREGYSPLKVISMRLDVPYWAESKPGAAPF